VTPALRRTLIALGVLVGAPLAAHWGVGVRARLVPPVVTVPSGTVQTVTADLRRLGASYVRTRGTLLEVGLVGDPEAIGDAHAKLLRSEMVEVETAVQAGFRRQVSWSVARALLLDLGQYRYAHVDRGLAPERRRELAAMAVGMAPDEFSDFLPTYQRLVYLHALYDIGLSFERSPLVGCTSFVVSGAATAGGGSLLARAFDFEVDAIFDERKAVFLVRETGAIPFASVAWPGLVGVVSGMNAEGVAVVVHGARAGDPQATGEPVTQTLRRVLSTARTAEEAVSGLDAREAMVSHIVVVADARGRTAVVERLPGRSNYVRWLPALAAVTNHFEGPAAGDPKNQRVRAVTSTLPRRARGDELVAHARRPVTVADAVAWLRDRRGVGGTDLPLGDRRAIDALIATHGVVMDTRARVLWVSESPHLLGRFVGFDLTVLLSPAYDPAGPPMALPTLPADPLLLSGAHGR
jgi:isopenicillin-N N-acyltransferase like protein